MIDRLRARHREGGLAGLLDSVANHLPGVQYFVLYATYRLRFEDCPGPDDVNPDVVVRRIDDESGIDALLAVQEKPERFRTRFALGDVAYLATVDERPVGYIWVHFSPQPIEERYGYRIAIEPSDAYGYDYYVLGEQRGRGVLRSLHVHAVDDLRRRTDRKALANVIEAPNRKSIRACTYLGFRRQRRFCAVKAFGRARVFRLD